MEATCRQYVSDVQQQLGLLNIDERVPARFVLSKLKAKARLLIKQDSDQRRLFLVSEVWKQIPCLEFMEVPFSACAPGVGGTIMRSCAKIPQVYQTTYGNLLKIFTIDGSRELKQTTLAKYKEIKRREHRDPTQLYFFLLDDYVWLPDTAVETAMGLGLFKHPHEVTRLVEPDSCLYPLDEYFPCPDYLTEVLMREVTLELAQTYRSIQRDEVPDGNANRK